MSASPSSSAQAKADDGKKSGDDSTTTRIREDAPPSLETMPTVIWERMLSFLAPAGISTMSHRISKTLGADGDKAKSPENSAKLALENMMSVAWKDASATYHYVSADDDYIDPSKSFEEMLYIPRFAGESYLRTFMIATIMLQGGENKLQTTTKNEGGTESNSRFHVTLIMWILYGRPALPPLSELGGSVASEMAKGLILLFVPKFDFVLGAPTDTREQRQETKENLSKYNRPRILALAERLSKMGQNSHSSMLLTMLAYGRPHMFSNRHVLQAEYFVGARVMLKGLSRKELNGKIGVVEKEYSENNERIGIVISDDENGENSRRIVGIKPGNLDLLEEDSEFLLDVKITFAHNLTRCIENDDTFLPDWMPLVVHTLRQIVAKLHDDANNTEEFEINVSDWAFPIFPTKSHRLIIAQTCLTILLTYIAKLVGMGVLPYKWGGLVCLQYDQIIALAEREDDDDDEDEEMIDSTIRVGVTQAFLGECVGLLKFCEETSRLIEEQKATYGLLKQQACSYFHYHAGCLGQGLGFPFVAMSNVGVGGVERATKDHIMVAIAGLRTEFEDLLDAYTSEENGHLTVDAICSTGTFPHSYARFLVSLAHMLAEAYHISSDAIELGPFVQTGEGTDYAMFSKFALAVAIRSLGRGHPMTDAVGQFHDLCSGSKIWGDRLCVFSSGLQSEVDEWIRDYVPLYYGTKRQHPALYHQIAGIDQDDDSDGEDDDE